MLAGDAVEIKKRAERRIGEIMAEMPKAKPPGGSKARPRKDRVTVGPDPLEKQGVDKHLADRARKAGSLKMWKAGIKAKTPLSALDGCLQLLQHMRP
jgi:hypothetical protein